MGSHLSRRGLLAGAAALAACNRKARGFAGYAFVANQDGRSVAAVDLRSFTLARQIPLDAAPAAVVAHPSRPAVYVLAPENGTIYEIDAAALAIQRRSRLARSAIGMHLAADGQSLWLLAREPRALVRVPLSDLRPSATIPLPYDPADFVLDQRPEGRLAAVSFGAEPVVALCDLAATSVLSIVAAGAQPRLAGFRKDGKHLLVGNGPDRLITIVDVTSAKIMVRLPLPLQPRHFCFLPDGGQLFVSGSGMDAVTIVEPFYTQVGETILAGRAPADLAAWVTSDHSFLFVSNPETGDVTVLDIDTRKLVVAVHVGMEPRQVLFTPDNQYALVLNHGSGDMAVIRMREFTSGPNAEWAQRHKQGGIFLMVPLGTRPVDGAIVAAG